jgi:hypothetical protein
MMTAPVIAASTPQWMFAGTLIALFAGLAILNAILFVGRYIIRPPRMPSLVPFLGGIVGTYGFYSAPSPSLQHLAWVPLLTDVGCIPWLLFCVWKVSHEKRQLRKDK